MGPGHFPSRPATCLLQRARSNLLVAPGPSSRPGDRGCPARDQPGQRGTSFILDLKKQLQTIFSYLGKTKHGWALGSIRDFVQTASVTRVFGFVPKAFVPQRKNKAFAGKRMQGVGLALGCSRRKGAVGEHWGPFPSPCSCMFTGRRLSKRLEGGLQHPPEPQATLPASSGQPSPGPAPSAAPSMHAPGNPLLAGASRAPRCWAHDALCSETQSALSTEERPRGYLGGESALPLQWGLTVIALQSLLTACHS